MLQVVIEKRDSKKDGSARVVRTTGKIPAVFYGPKEASTPISVNEIDFLKVWKQAGESTVITLKDGSEEHDALIHDIDREAVSGKIRHIDFYVIEKGKKVQVGTPIEFAGVAPAVKDLGGVLVKVLHEIEVEALPKDLPHRIDVDISSLVDFDAQIKAGDITLPAGVTLITEADEVVALVAAPKEEVEEIAAPIDMAAIELSEKKGKKDEEGAEGEAAAETK